MERDRTEGAEGMTADESEGGTRDCLDLLKDAVLYSADGREAEAAEALARALSLDPANACAIYLGEALPRVRSEPENLFAVETVLARAVRDLPGNAWAHYLRARLARWRGEDAMALGFIDAAIAGDPETARFHTTRADLLERLHWSWLRGEEEERRPLVEAVRSWQAAVRLEPGNAEHRFRLSGSLSSVGQMDAAIAAGRAALARAGAAGLGRGFRELAHAELAVLLLDTGQLDQALEHAQAATAPAGAEAHHSAQTACVYAGYFCVLGQVHAVRGERARAEASLRQALALDPELDLEAELDWDLRHLRVECEPVNGGAGAGPISGLTVRPDLFTGE